jgi:hypothetical protein
MRKHIFLVLALALAFTLAACGGNETPAALTGSGTTPPTTQGGSDTTTPSSTPDNNGGDHYNPNDHFTAVPVDIDFVEDWMLPTDGVITEVELEDEGLGIYMIRIEGISKAQKENFEKTLESKGMGNFMDTWSDDAVVIDFTNTFLEDKAEGSILILRMYER